MKAKSVAMFDWSVLDKQVEEYRQKLKVVADRLPVGTFTLKQFCEKHRLTKSGGLSRLTLLTKVGVIERAGVHYRMDERGRRSVRVLLFRLKGTR